MSEQQQQVPVLTPSFVVAGKEQAVVVEFPGPLPSSGLVTFAFYMDESGPQLGSNVPVARLGPATVKANFPKFMRPGQMGVSVHIMREQNHLFPKFSLQVLSPLEAMFSILSKKKREGEEEPDNSGGSDSGSTANSLAVLASMLAFLANSDEDRDEVARTDQLVCRALQDVSPARLSDWHLGPLLSGRLGWDETLLHVCARQRLEETALMLLQPHYAEGKAFYLLKKAPYDNKTPLDIARKNGMKRMAGFAEMTMGIHKSPSTPKDKRKRKSSISRSSSIDTNLHLSVREVETAVGSPNAGKKEKKGGGNKLKKLFGKEKEKETKAKTPSHQSGGDKGARRSSELSWKGVEVTQADWNSKVAASQTLPHSLNNSVQTPVSSAPPDDSSQQTSPALSSASVAPNEVKKTSISRDHPLPLPQSLPRDFRQSMTSSLSSSCEDSRGGSRVSSREYDSSLPPRDVVRPVAEAGQMSTVGALTQDRKYSQAEYDDDDDENIYKVPKNVIRVDNSNSEDEEDIYKVPRNIPRPSEALSDDEDIYKIPRNIPRAPVGSDSDDEDIYKVPKNLPIQDSADGDIYNVPRNVLAESQALNQSDPDIYNVPRSLVRPPGVTESGSDDDDDHLYEKVPEEFLSEARLNSMLHNLPEGHYMKVPSKDFLQRHSVSSASEPQQQTGGSGGDSSTGSPLLDRLIMRASGRKGEEKAAIKTLSGSSTTRPKEGNDRDSCDDDDNDDGAYDYPHSSTLDRQVISLGGSAAMITKANMLHKNPIRSIPSAPKEDIGSGGEEEEVTENIYDEPADLFQRYTVAQKDEETSSSGVYDDVAGARTEQPKATPATDFKPGNTFPKVSQGKQQHHNSYQHRQVAGSATLPALGRRDMDSDSQGKAELPVKSGSNKSHYQKITSIFPKANSSAGSSRGFQLAKATPAENSPAISEKVPLPVPPPLPESSSLEGDNTPSPPSTLERNNPPSSSTPTMIPSSPHLSAESQSLLLQAKVLVFPSTHKVPPSPPLPEKVPVSSTLKERVPPSPPLPERVPVSSTLQERVPPSPPLPERVPVSTTSQKRVPPSPPLPERAQVSWTSQEKVPPSPPLPERVPVFSTFQERIPPSPPLPERVPVSSILQERVPSSPPLPERESVSSSSFAKPQNSPSLPPRALPSSPTLAAASLTKMTPPPSPTAVRAFSPLSDAKTVPRNVRSHTVSQEKEDAHTKKLNLSPIKKPRTNTVTANFSNTRSDQITNKLAQPPVPKPRKPKADTLSTSSASKPPAAPSSPKVRSLGRDQNHESHDSSLIEQKVSAFNSTPPSSPISVTKKPPVKSRASFQDDSKPDILAILNRKAPKGTATNSLSSTTPEVSPKPKRNYNAATVSECNADQSGASSATGLKQTPKFAFGPKIPVPKTAQVPSPKPNQSPIPGPKPGQNPVPSPKPNQSPVPGPKPQRSRNMSQSAKTSPFMYPKNTPNS